MNFKTANRLEDIDMYIYLLLVNIVLTVLESSLKALVRSLGVNVGTGEQLIFGEDLIPPKPCMFGKFFVFCDL